MSVREARCLHPDRGTLIRKKTGRDGVTTALASRKSEDTF